MRTIREKVFRLRGGIWTLLFLLILLLARPTRQSLLLGLPFVVLGQAWRFWAVGCIGRYRGEAVGAERLATWGPYAFMRNPLYFGNGLIGLGWGLMAGPWAAVLFLERCCSTMPENGRALAAAWTILPVGGNHTSWSAACIALPAH